jgi:hypothetical protein
MIGEHDISDLVLSLTSALATFLMLRSFCQEKRDYTAEMYLNFVNSSEMEITTSRILTEEDRHSNVLMQFFQM